MTELEGLGRVLGDLAGLSEATHQMARRLRRHSGVASASRSIDLRKYKTSDILEGFVDVERTDGTARTYWFELRWTLSSWILESSLRAIGITGEQGRCPSRR